MKLCARWALFDLLGRDNRVFWRKSDELRPTPRSPTASLGQVTETWGWVREGDSWPWHSLFLSARYGVPRAAGGMSQG